MASRTTISDPKSYPVIFSLSSRVATKPAEDTAVVPFLIDDDASVRGAVLRFEQKYQLDTDPFSSGVPLALPERKVIHEIAANSGDPEQTQIILKIWTSATNFQVCGYADLGEVRQPKGSSEVTHSIYVSTGLGSFSGVEVSGVAYYPSVTVSYKTEPFTDGASTSASGTVAAGVSRDFAVAAAADSGIVWILFKMTASWYLDAARTVPAASVPESLPDLNGQIAVRSIFADGGRFSQGGQVESGGTATFASVPKGNSAPIVEISYLGAASDGELFVHADVVKITEDGLPDQPGNDSAVYMLENPL